MTGACSLVLPNDVEKWIWLCCSFSSSVYCSNYLIYSQRKKNLVFQVQDRKCEVQGNTKPFVAARSYTSKPNAVLYWQYRLSQGQLKCYSFCTVTLIPRDISRSSTLGAERQIYLQLGLKNNIKTVGVGSGCQGWKVADPYCWWSVEEANIQPDHAQTLASRGQRETICEENAHTRTHTHTRCTENSSVYMHALFIMCQLHTCTSEGGACVSARRCGPASCKVISNTCLCLWLFISRLVPWLSCRDTPRFSKCQSADLWSVLKWFKKTTDVDLKKIKK